MKKATQVLQIIAVSIFLVIFRTLNQLVIDLDIHLNIFDKWHQSPLRIKPLF